MDNPQPYTARYDRSDDEPLSVAVVNAVATGSDVDATDLEPLHEVIDTDALDRLFDHLPAGADTAGVVRFEYNSCLVTISVDGEIRIEPA